MCIRDSFCAVDRVEKMKVGVDKFAVFFARGAFATGVFGRAVAAIDVLCISQRKRQFTGAFRTQEKLGMANAVLENSAPQPLLQRLLPD